MFLGQLRFLGHWPLLRPAIFVGFLFGLIIRRAGRVLDGMAQPDHPAFERLAADKPKRLSCAWTFAVRSVIVDDAWHPGYPIDSGMNQGAELVDQAVPEKGAVDDAAAFEKQLL